MDLRNTNLRDAKVTSTSGKDVKDTKQLSGEASDSLGGKNATEQYFEQTPKKAKDKLGGEDCAC